MEYDFSQDKVNPSSPLINIALSQQIKIQDKQFLELLKKNEVRPLCKIAPLLNASQRKALCLFLVENVKFFLTKNIRFLLTYEISVYQKIYALMPLLKPEECLRFIASLLDLGSFSDSALNEILAISGAAISNLTDNVCLSQRQREKFISLTLKALMVKSGAIKKSALNFLSVIILKLTEEEQKRIIETIIKRLDETKEKENKEAIINEMIDVLPELTQKVRGKIKALVKKTIDVLEEKEAIKLMVRLIPHSDTEERKDYLSLISPKNKEQDLKQDREILSSIKQWSSPESFLVLTSGEGNDLIQWAFNVKQRALASDKQLVLDALTAMVPLLPEATCDKIFNEFFLSFETNSREEESNHSFSLEGGSDQKNNPEKNSPKPKFKMISLEDCPSPVKAELSLFSSLIPQLTEENKEKAIDFSKKLLNNKYGLLWLHELKKIAPKLTDKACDEIVDLLTVCKFIVDSIALESKKVEEFEEFIELLAIFIPRQTEESCKKLVGPIKEILEKCDLSLSSDPLQRESTFYIKVLDVFAALTHKLNDSTAIKDLSEVFHQQRSKNPHVSDQIEVQVFKSTLDQIQGSLLFEDYQEDELVQEALSYAAKRAADLSDYTSKLAGFFGSDDRHRTNKINAVFGLIEKYKKGTLDEKSMPPAANNGKLKNIAKKMLQKQSQKQSVQNKVSNVP